MNNKRQVFVVDDDKSAKNGIARMVRAGGYSVATYASAIEFLTILNSEITGCVILDARMPSMSGEELASKLMAYGEKLSVIFVTADDDPVVKRKANKMGAAGFFRKPVDGTALLDAINWSFNTIDENNQSMT